MKNALKYLPENKKYSRYSVINDEIIFKEQPLKCEWRFNSIILANGDVTSCCEDVKNIHMVGNVLDKNFWEVWGSKEYRALRKKVLNRSLEICEICN